MLPDLPAPGLVVHAEQHGGYPSDAALYQDELHVGIPLAGARKDDAGDKFRSRELEDRLGPPATVFSDAVVSLFGVLGDSPMVWKEIGSPYSSTAAHRMSHSFRNTGSCAEAALSSVPLSPTSAALRTWRAASSGSRANRQPAAASLSGLVLQKSEMYRL